MDRARLFMSFRDGFVSGDWVAHARSWLEKWFEVYDYRVVPETDPNLDVALQQRISDSDVFICLLSERYHENIVTRAEFEDAVRRSTGSKLGSLRDGQRRPLIYVVTCDDWAEKWLQKKYPGFTYLPLSMLQFAPDGSHGFYPKEPDYWDAWLDGAIERLKVLPLVRRLPVIDAPATVAIFGRPNGIFGPQIADPVAALVSSLQVDTDSIQVADKWHDERSPAAKRAAAAVVAGGKASLLVQACDDSLAQDNRMDEDGMDLRLKLQQTGVERQDADVVLTRTLFWSPVANVQSTFVDPVAAISDFDVAATGPWFLAAHAPILADCIRARLANPALVLKAEDGMGEIGKKLQQRLRQVFGPFDYDIVEAQNIPLSIRRAAEDGLPILLAIHDRNINELYLNPRREIRRRAASFDRKIAEEIGDASGLRVARAILLIRHAEKFEQAGFRAEEEWILLPLDRERDYAPPPERLEAIRNALHPN